MSIYLWIAFICSILVMLSIDLGVFGKKSQTVTFAKSLIWTAVWVSVALLFNVGVYFIYEHNLCGIADTLNLHLTGSEAALQFLTGYIVEKSLSMDNIFVMAVIFGYFGVPMSMQHRVLFLGILGALILRGAMIATGTALIHYFDWIVYVFGALLVYTAYKMFKASDEAVEPEKNVLVKFARKFWPVTSEFQGEKFFVKQNGIWAITPLFLCLLVIESTDVLFAIDSIPAIFALTKDPFIVFTSNIFAILGLRAMYFMLSAMINKFQYLKYSLIFVLAFIGVKMLASGYFHLPIGWSLAVIGLSLSLGIGASYLKPLDKST